MPRHGHRPHDTDYVTSKVSLFRVGAIMGLGLAYAGTGSETVTELLLPVLEETGLSEEVYAVTAIALGQIHVATGNMSIAEAIVQCLLVKKEEQLNNLHSRMLAMAVGLVFMGKQASAEVKLHRDRHRQQTADREGGGQKREV